MSRFLAIPTGISSMGPRAAPGKSHRCQGWTSALSDRPFFSAYESEVGRAPRPGVPLGVREKLAGRTIGEQAVVFSLRESHLRRYIPTTPTIQVTYQKLAWLSQASPPVLHPPPAFRISPPPQPATPEWNARSSTPTGATASPRASLCAPCDLFPDTPDRWRTS
jgi:hypothetical protein